jgi:hypothetical protein
MPARTNWIDRGDPVESPGPGEYRELSQPPAPWLVIGQTPSTQFVVDDD